MSNQTKNLRNWVVIGIAVLSIFWFAFDYKEKEATAEQVITIEDEQLGYGFPTANVLRVQDNEFIYYVDKSDGTRYDFILGDTASETAPFLFDASTSSTHIEILTINNLYTLPTADGNASDVIITDGSGVLSWTAQSGGTTSDQFWYAVGTTGMSASTTLPLVYASTTETDYASITKDLTVSDDLYIDDDANAVIIASTSPTYTETLIAYGSSTDENIMMFWNADYGAFRTGLRSGTNWNDTNIGEYSFAGGSSKASGNYSFAMGQGAQATKDGAIAMGYSAKAIGGNYIYNSIAIGAYNQATGGSSVALGYNGRATNWYTVAIGHQSNVSGARATNVGGEGGNVSGSRAVNIGGYANIVMGESAVAIGGYRTQAGDSSGDLGAIAIGYLSEALAPYTVVIGYQARAESESSMAIGTNVSSTAVGAITIGSGLDDDNYLGNANASSLAIGFSSTTATLTVSDSNVSTSGDLQVDDYLYVDSENASVIIGSSSPEYTYDLIAYGSSTDEDVMMFYDSTKGAMRGGKRAGDDWDDVNVGEGSFSWGSQTTASGLYSVALGYNNWATGNYSIALGYGAASSGYQAISLGDTNDASGYHSIAMSAQALASGQGSIAIGDYNTASATNSLAIGYGNTAVGTYSFSAGYKSQSGDASGDTGAISVGYYADALNETSMAIGTYISTTADGAMTFGSGADQDNPLINSNASSLAVGFSSTTATMIVQDGNTSTTGDFQADDYLFVDSTNEAVVIASSTPLYTKTLIAYGSSTNEDIQMFWDGNKGAFRGGLRYSTFWDDASVGEYSFAFGSKARASGDGSIAIGGSTASQWFDTTASGKESVAIGGRATASGIISIAMGYEANATSDYSVAIGRGNDAIKYAAAIGYGNNASGEASSAFGRGNISSGMNSTAIGKSNTSSGFESIAVGAYSQANHVLSVAVGGHSITDGKSSLAVGIYAKAGTDGSDYGATAIGYYADALENESIAIGTYISSTGDGSIVLGSGVATDDPLVNSTADSLAIGLASTTATLTVKDGYVSTTGDLSVDEDLYVVGTLYGGSPLDIGSAVSTTGDMSVSADLYADGVLVVPVKTTTGHPASPVNGQIYVNTFDNNFYGYADGDWRELSGAWLGIYQPEEEQTIQYLPEEKKFDWAYLIIPIFLLELFRAIKYLIKKLKIYEN